MIIATASNSLMCFYMSNPLLPFIWPFSAKWQRFSHIRKHPKAHKINNSNRKFQAIHAYKIRTSTASTGICAYRLEIKGQEPK